MGTRGPVRRSAAPKLRLVGGDDESEAREAVANETATRLMSPTKPERPEGLPEAVGEVFDRLAEELDSAGMVAQVDAPLLELAARAYLLAADASDELIQEGLTTSGSQGQLVAHPNVAVFRASAATFMEASKQLGLSFAARARIAVPKGDQDALDRGNPFAGEATGS